MNVDENSELRNGDKGFAACYKTNTGDYWVDNTRTKTNMAAPAWVFLGEVKAVNSGTAVKETGKNGWLESSDGWSTYSKTWAEVATIDTCATINAANTDKPSYVYPYHSTLWKDNSIGASTGQDWIGLLSEKGFKNTGLNNGENHLKCWYNGVSAGSEFDDTEDYSKTWTPDFSDKDGQSL